MVANNIKIFYVFALQISLTLNSMNTFWNSFLSNIKDRGKQVVAKQCFVSDK